MEAGGSRWLGRLYLIVMFIFLYVPIAYLIVYSFNAGGQMHHFSGFTLDWYRELFSDTRLLIIVLNTVIIALLSSAVATAIGTMGAIGLFFLIQRRARESLITLNNVLIVNPDVVIGASFLILFTVLGIQLGFISVLIAHIAFSIPIVVLMVLPKLYEMPKTLIDAATDLGAPPRQVLTRVIIPFITPGMMAGFFMALTYSLDDFAVTFFVTGSGFSTLSVEIYSRARHGISLSINALSTILFGVTMLLVFGYYWISQRGLRRVALWVKR